MGRGFMEQKRQRQHQSVRRGCIKTERQEEGGGGGDTEEREREYEEKEEEAAAARGGKTKDSRE